MNGIRIYSMNAYYYSQCHIIYIAIHSIQLVIDGTFSLAYYMYSVNISKLYVIHYNKEQLLLAQGVGAGPVL